MTDHSKTARDEIIAQFAGHAAKLFAADFSRRSAMMVVAQYWNDQATDEVHARVIASTRPTPVWPHECGYDGEDDPQAILEGEACWWCGGRDIDMSFYGAYGDATVSAIEMFCREGAHQNQPTEEAYVPFAIARPRDGQIDIEVIGHAERPPASTIGSTATYDWPDARARALFDEVCRHADDDGPRAVLSDYLLEAHPDDVRGEAIALALATDLDATARARRDALFTAHAERWMFPLGDVIVPGCAHFERGFLARADVYADSAADRDRVMNAPAWGTVHTIRFAPQSRDLVAPTMLGLRSVGPLRDDGAAQIARSRRPWRIEHLRIESTLAPLLSATNLPRLVHLDVPATMRAEVDALAGAPWWKQLARLCFFGVDDPPALAEWRALQIRLELRELAIITGGWQLGFRAGGTVSVQWGAWDGNATLERLAKHVVALPEPTQIVLVSTAQRGFGADDVAWLHAQTGRDIGLGR